MLKCKASMSSMSPVLRVRGSLFSSREASNPHASHFVLTVIGACRRLHPSIASHLHTSHQSRVDLSSLGSSNNPPPRHQLYPWKHNIVHVSV